MAIRYTPDELKYLRDSPLVVKPPGLPPAEQWMGPPADSARNTTKPNTDRARNDSNILTDQSNRRLTSERHVSRSSANPEDVILAPPKTSFMSATSIRNPTKTFDSTDRPSLRETDSRDRFNFRNKPGEGDGERGRDSRNNNLRPKRAEGEDSDGWSTVKPRKSFGTEGAERFNGRMGVSHRDERRFKDREDREGKDRPRGFDTFSRDRVEKEGDIEQERDNRRNGTGRGRNEPSWFKDKENADQPPPPRDRNSNGDRFGDRSRGWREKERDERVDRAERTDRGDRGDRRWDRDREQRQEREPEWMDAPSEEKSQAHTQEEFQKWKEQMQGKDKPAKTLPEEAPAQPDAGASFFELESKKKVETPLAIETGPDKFFGMWATPKDENPPEAGVEAKKEGAAKSKTVGKASRFTSFFTPHEESLRRQTEPVAAMPPTAQGGLGALFSSSQSTQGDAEREAFQQLLQKLQSQTVGGNSSTPPASDLQQRRPPPLEKPQGNPPPEQFQQYRPERQEETRPNTHNSQQALQDLMVQRQMTGSQPVMRPEQVLQELVGQRQNALSQASSRPDQPQSRNSNTDFLMGLMQSAKAAPEPQRTEQALLGMPGKAIDRQMQQRMMEREQELHREVIQRERNASQRQGPNQPQPPPGFYEDPASFQRGPPQPQHERQPVNPPQPTRILQRPMERPTPPGLELGWDRQAQLLPQHRILQGPPPGLASGRGMSMPHYPPGFPMGDFPPPNMMAGPPGPRNMHAPPGFYNGPPGFLPPPGMSGFQEMTFPFDGRGPPSQGPYRRQ